MLEKYFKELLQLTDDQILSGSQWTSMACSCFSKKNHFLCAVIFSSGIFRREECKGYSAYLKQQKNNIIGQYALQMQ